VLKFFVEHLEAYGIGAVFGAMAFLLINVAIGRDILPSERRPHEEITGPIIETDPERIYASTCAACHQAEAQGMAGQFPPLAGSSWLAGDPETPIRIVLAGLSGPIDVEGQTYNGIMPAQSHLNDEQIANVLTYVRSNFGNDASPIEPSLVATLRAELAGRTTPWNGGAELEALRSQ